MKKFILFLTLLTGFSFYANAQYIGIGNTNPFHTLDISGRIRLRGGVNNNFSSGLWLAGTGADSTSDKIFMGMRNDSTAGFYHNIGGWAFHVNGLNGNIGIRNADPRHRLSFDNTAGDKLALFAEPDGRYYGLGIGSSSLQITTPFNSSNILFGFGRSASFTETMRLSNGNLSIGTSNNSLAGLTVDKKMGATHAIFGSNTTGVAIESDYPGIGFNSYYNNGRKTIATGFGGYIGVNPQRGGMTFQVTDQSNNAGSIGIYKTAIDIKADGKVGIGLTDAAFQLDVAGRMRIRSTAGLSAGHWLNNDINNASPAFMGMQANDQVGFFGSGTGWSFLMNTQTGAVSFAGNAGQPGQVLTSNGTAGAPGWQATGGSKLFVARPTANSPDVINSKVDVPGLTANFTLTASSQVLFNFKLQMQNRGCFGCGDRRTFVELHQIVPGTTNVVGTSTVYTRNESFDDAVSGPIVVNLAPGSHSFKVMLAPSIFGAANVFSSISQGILTWQIFPD